MLTAIQWDSLHPADKAVAYFNELGLTMLVQARFHNNRAAAFAEFRETKCTVPVRQQVGNYQFGSH